MGILATFLVLSFVVFFHELGHFVAAKWAKIRVYEFAVGFGPKVYGYLKNSTLFSFRILPLGGFVKLAGMDEDQSSSEEIQEHEKYGSKTVYQRMVVIVAGSVMNLILGFLIYCLLNFFVGTAQILPVLENVFPQTPAANAGLQVGDELIKINGDPIHSVERDVLPVIQSSLSKTVLLTLRRGDSQKTVEIIPVQDEDQRTKIGIQFEIQQERYRPIHSLVNAFSKTGASILEVFKTFSMLINKQVSVKDLAGPVGIFQIASHQFNQSVIAFLSLMAYISISLGVINLFPFPVLDGGHLFFLIWEAVFKKPVSKRVETVMSYISISLLISLMIFVLLNDVLNWQSRAELIKRIFSGG